MTNIYTVTLEDEDQPQNSAETGWSSWNKCYPSLDKAKVAVLEDLVGFRETSDESITVLPPILKIEDNPIWILDDIPMTGLIWTIFETELQE